MDIPLFNQGGTQLPWQSTPSPQGLDPSLPRSAVRLHLEVLTMRHPPRHPWLMVGGLERLEENPPENTDVWWFFGKLKEKNIKDSNKFWTNLCKHAPSKLMKTIWKPWHAPGPGPGLIKISTCLAETLSTPGGLSGQAVQTHGGFARPSTCQQGFGLPTVESAKWHEYLPGYPSKYIQIHMPRYWYTDAMYML